MKKLGLAIVLLLFFVGVQAFAGDAFVEYKLRNNEVLMNQSTFTYNNLDPTMPRGKKSSYFPGFRGANQMIIYTPEFGERTNTNEYGGEAIVIGDTVVEMSGADSLIPQGGLVISGHGRAKMWINENLIVGSKVYINKANKTITAYTTTDSYIYRAETEIKEVKYIVGKYLQTHAGYSSQRAQAFIVQAENYIDRAKRTRLNSSVKRYSELAIEAADNALAAAIPYKTGEIRGVWIRPTFHSREQICSVLDRISKAGLNAIFLETYYHGMTIFPSETMKNRGFVEVNPEYEKFDALDFWIHEAHKRNIKVHVWFETFYIGNKNPASNPKNIISINPSWGNLTKKDYESNKATPSIAEHNGYFLDPANPEIQDFLEELLCEIIKKYNPDGVNLDYIRYPQSISSQYTGSDISGWGYTRYARNEYKSIYGVDPVELTQFEPLWETWNNYRRNKITLFVQKASRICRANGVMLTAVIFPNRQAALDTKQQDWRTWSYQNYVDGFTPLFLTCDPTTASGLMREVLSNKSPCTKLFAGLFITFMNGAESDLMKQINELRFLSLDGFGIFDYAHLADKYIHPLSMSVCSMPENIKEKSNSRNNKGNNERKFFRRRT